MKKKKSKKIQNRSKIKNQELGQTKNSAKLVLFLFLIQKMREKWQNLGYFH